MVFSTSYHLFRDQGPKENQIFLKFDLTGIVITIFLMCVAGTFLGFTRYPTERRWFITAVCVVYISNIVLSFTPCYAHERFECCRITINILTVLFNLLLAIVWVCYFGNQEEISLFFWPLMGSFFWGLVGFIFYSTRFPESYITEAKFGKRAAYIAQIYFQSHTWWHISAVLSFQTLYIVMNRIIVYYEKLK